MLNVEKLIDWCWCNLEFDNCPENWQETYIEDIINGYNGNCHTVKGKSLSYSDIRLMFMEEEEG